MSRAYTKAWISEHAKPLSVVSVFVVLFGTYCASQLPGDVIVNIGAQNGVTGFEGGLGGIDSAWDLRGPLHKVLIYALSRSATGFGFEVGSVGFEVFFKIAYFALFNLLFFHAYLRSSFKHNKLIALTILNIVIISCSNSNIPLQADLSAAIVGVSIVGYLNSEKMRFVFLSGFLCSMTFGFKGVTILTGISAILVGLAISENYVQKRSHILRGILLGIAVQVIAFYYLMPNSLADLLESGKFQEAYRAGLLRRVLVTTISVIFQSPHVPFMWISILIVVKLITIKERSYSVFFLASGISVAATSLFIQSMGFGYHLVVLIPMSIVLIHLFFDNFTLTGVKNKYLVPILTALCVMQFVPNYVYIDLLPFDTNTLSIVQHNSERNASRIEISQISEFADSECGESVLYLGTGVPAYFLTNRSYLRSTYPLELLREGYVQDFSASFIKFSNRFNTFDGKCIIQDADLNVKDQPWLAANFGFINSKYTATIRTANFVLYTSKAAKS